MVIKDEGSNYSSHPSFPNPKFPLSLPSSHHLNSNLTTSSSDSFLHSKHPFLPPPIPPPPSQPSRIKPFILRSTSPNSNKARGGSAPRESKKNRPTSLDNLLEPVVPINFKSHKLPQPPVSENVPPPPPPEVPIATTSTTSSMFFGKKVKAVSNLMQLQRSSSKTSKLSSTGSSSSLFGLIGGIDGDDGGLIKKTKKRSYREERKRKDALSDLGSQESAERAERAREQEIELESKRWAGTFAMNRTGSPLGKGKGKVQESPKKARLGDATNRLSSSSIPASPPASPTKLKSKLSSSQLTSLTKSRSTSPFDIPSSIVSIRTPSKSKLRPSSSAASLTTPGENQRGTGVKSSYRDDTGNFIGRNRKPGLAGRRPASSQELSSNAEDGKENGYSSLQELLESSGFTDTRVITPIIPRTLAVAHLLSAADPHSDPETIFAPSSLVESTSSHTPTLRPKPSLLSIRNILNLWQAPVTSIECINIDNKLEDEEEELLSEEDTINLKIVEERKERAVEWRDNVAREVHEANIVPPRASSLSRSPPLMSHRLQPEPIAIVIAAIETVTSTSAEVSTSIIEPAITSAADLHQLKRKKSTSVLDLGLIPFGRRPRKGLTFTPSNRKTSGTAKMEVDTFNAKPSTVVFTRKDAIPTTRILGGSGSDSGGRRALRHALSSPNILTASKQHIYSSSININQPLTRVALPPTPPKKVPELTYQSFEFDIRSYDNTTSTIEGEGSTSSILSGSEEVRREYDDESDDDDEPVIRRRSIVPEVEVPAPRLSWKSSILALPSLLRTRASSAAIGLGLTRNHDDLPPPLPLHAAELIAAVTAVVQGDDVEAAPVLLRKAASQSALRPILTRGEVDWDWGGGIISGGVIRGIRPEEVYRGRF